MGFSLTYVFQFLDLRFLTQHTILRRYVVKGLKFKTEVYD